MDKDKVKVIKVQESIFSKNDAVADSTRKFLQKNGTFMINVMSSPGSGKTTLLTSLINKMKSSINIMEMDVDIESTVDAQRVADDTGIKSIQIHNGGLCHIDAQMVSDALNQTDLTGVELLFLENIGNLVCPAEFDTGAHLNMMLLSVSEGDDKPIKYPLMFSVCDIIVITKSDTLEYFDFDFEKCKRNILNINKKACIVSLSAKTGEGVDTLIDIILNKMKN